MAVCAEMRQQPGLVLSSSSSSFRDEQGIRGGAVGREAICWIWRGVVRSAPRITYVDSVIVLVGWWGLDGGGTFCEMVWRVGILLL